MSIHEKIAELKQELQQSSSQQYKEAVQRQIDRLTHYVLNGCWPK